VFPEQPASDTLIVKRQESQIIEYPLEQVKQMTQTRQPNSAIVTHARGKPRGTINILQKVMLIYNRLVSMIVFILWEQVNQKA
jgi:hypothetical protein